VRSICAEKAAAGRRKASFGRNSIIQIVSFKLFYNQHRRQANLENQISRGSAMLVDVIVTLTILYLESPGRMRESAAMSPLDARVAVSRLFS
jgi:hypothetical protein